MLCSNTEHVSAHNRTVAKYIDKEKSERCIQNDSLLECLDTVTPRSSGYQRRKLEWSQPVVPTAGYAVCEATGSEGSSCQRLEERQAGVGYGGVILVGNPAIVAEHVALFRLDQP